MPYTPKPIPPAIPPLVREVALEHHLPPELVAAVAWRESEYVGNSLTPNDGDTGVASVGLMRVHLSTVRVMSDPYYAGLSVEQLLDDRTNLETGCLIMRFRLKLVLLQAGYKVDADYDNVPFLLSAMTPRRRHEILSWAVAAYTTESAVYWWPDKLHLSIGLKMARVKYAYVRDVMRNYDRLIAAAE